MWDAALAHLSSSHWCFQFDGVKVFLKILKFVIMQRAYVGSQHTLWHALRLRDNVFTLLCCHGDRRRRRSVRRRSCSGNAHAAALCLWCCVVFVTRTIMGPHGANRTVQRLEFRDCRKGLGELWPLTSGAVITVPSLTAVWCCRCEDNRRLQRAQRRTVRDLHQAGGQWGSGSSGW